MERDDFIGKVVSGFLVASLRYDRLSNMIVLNISIQCRLAIFLGLSQAMFLYLASVIFCMILK